MTQHDPGKGTPQKDATGVPGGRRPEADDAAIDALYQGPSDIAEFAALVGINVPDGPGGACPAPLTFVAFGESREFPLDPICEFLSYLSVFVVFGAVFAGLRIAVKG